MAQNSSTTTFYRVSTVPLAPTAALLGLGLLARDEMTLDQQLPVEFAGCAEVDVEHLLGLEREGLADRLEVLGLAGEFRG